MEYIVEGRSKKKTKFIEAIMPSIIRQLNLNNSRKALVVRLEHDCDGMGFTMPFDTIDSYIVVIKSTMSIKDIGLTLAHEMVHVRQMARGLLKTMNGVKYWRGRRYTKRTKYLDQPWEQDAFARQELIFRKAIAE